MVTVITVERRKLFLRDTFIIEVRDGESKTYYNKSSQAKDTYEQMTKAGAEATLDNKMVIQKFGCRLEADIVKQMITELEAGVAANNFMQKIKYILWRLKNEKDSRTSE